MAIDLTVTLRVPGTITTFRVVDAMGEEIARVMTRHYGEGEARYLSGYATTAKPKPRVRVTPGQYHGKDGFHIRSNEGDSIFTETKTSAEKIRARLLAGEDTRASDFLP